MADSKENYWLDLGSEKVNPMFMQVVKSAYQEWDNIVHTAFQDSET